MKVDLHYALLVVVSYALVTPAVAQESSSVPQRVEITFAGRLAGKPFDCGSQYEDIGTKKSTVTPQDLRFFVSDVELLDVDGKAVPVVLEQDGVWQYKSVALIDLEDGTYEMQSVRSGRVFDDFAFGINPGNPIWLWDWLYGDNQAVYLEPMD